MTYEYFFGLPENRLFSEIRNKKVAEIWVVFAYFSKTKIVPLLRLLNEKDESCKIHFVISSSSINPLHILIEHVNIINKENFNFHLIDQPLMHSKLFAVRTNNEICIYVGSANLTTKAVNENIETGIFLNFKKNKDKGYLKAFNFLKELMNKCYTDDSKDRLLIKSTFSYIREELIFLAFEQSKLRQAMVYTPNKLKNIFPDLPQDNQESLVNIKTKNTLITSILDYEERDSLLQAEKDLRESIKKDCAIKVDNFGWLTSRWSLKDILRGNSEIENAYRQLVEIFDLTRNKYRTPRYRNRFSRKISTMIYNQIERSDMEMTEEISIEVDTLIKTLIYKLKLPVNNRKSLYLKLENLYHDIKNETNLITLLNPYKIGDEDTDLSENGIDLLTSDQINLLAMCELAIKLRSGKPPKIPAVWWFDYCIDISSIIGSFDSNKTDYKKDTTRLLKSLKQQIEDNDPKDSLDDYLKEFCSLTGFNLTFKNPIINKLRTQRKYICDLEVGQYAFLPADSPNLKIPTESSYNLPEFNYVFEENKIVEDVEKVREVDLVDIEGKFVLGNNLFFYYDEDVTKEIYLCITSKEPG